MWPAPCRYCTIRVSPIQLAAIIYTYFSTAAEKALRYSIISDATRCDARKCQIMKLLIQTAR